MFSQSQPTHWKVINSDEAVAVCIWSRVPGPNVNQGLSRHISHQVVSGGAVTIKAMNFQQFQVESCSIMSPASLQLQ